jgi:hypothetical protein
MIFRSRWRFEIGVQLSVALVAEHPEAGRSRIAAEGIVVWCEPVPGQPKTYESTILFLELPDELKRSLREFSRQRV